MKRRLYLHLNIQKKDLSTSFRNLPPVVQEKQPRLAKMSFGLHTVEKCGR